MQYRIIHRLINKNNYLFEIGSIVDFVDIINNHYHFRQKKQEVFIPFHLAFKFVTPITFYAPTRSWQAM